MNILILCACLFGLFVLQACFIVFLLSYIKAKIYADITALFKDFFVPAKDGELSKAGMMMTGLADQFANQFADTIFTKLKMSAIGQKGGSSPRAGSEPNFMSSLIPMLINRFAPGGIQGLLGGLGGLGGANDGGSQPSDNHASDNSPKFKLGGR